MEQTSTDKTDYRFPLAIYKPLTGDNVDVSLRFKAVAGAVDQAGGIAVRLSTPDDYYVVRANALEDNVRFYRVVKGRREQLAGHGHQGPRQRVAHARAARGGRHYSQSRSTARRCTRRATAPSAGAGRVALWTKADSVTRFDSIAIKTCRDAIRPRSTLSGAHQTRRATMDKPATQKLHPERRHARRRRIGRDSHPATRGIAQGARRQEPKR